MLKVVVADDSELMRERLVAMISELETVELVGQASDANEALEIIQRLQPDVAILDIRMPGGGGIRVLETIKQEATPPVVIMLTAFPYPQYRRKCLQAGADYFTDKSTEFHSVGEVLRQLGCEKSSDGRVLN
jgi:DNA-binding NarL/FixJ family response regulator